MFVEESSPEENALPIEVSNFSSLTRVVNVLQKVLLFIDKLKHRQTDSSGRAKRLLLAAMQREEFPEEILYLKSPSGRNISPRVSGLGLFMDDEGLIRASGRIQSSNVHPYKVKHPILLGKHHHLTELVIKEAHLNCCHLGTNSTLSKLRLMGFWVPQGRQSVKRVVRHCLVCKKINSLPFEAPVGSQLPVHRANFLHPFQQVGVDFTGHFWLKLNGEDVKMYILLFTCMSLRAVHLELLPDMSTRSFLLAFFRFTNLFGVPTHVYSDNAKTFVASGMVLSEVFVSDEFKNHFRSTSITHVTIPLYSAWHGGAWERMIQTVKQCLKKLVGREKLEYFDFLTILADVERAVNDRPLTYIDSSDMGLDILTPNHFLQTGYNPRLLLGNHEVDDLCPDPPSRIELLESLQLRENYVEKFRRLWHHDYLLSLREHHKDLLSHCPERISVGEIVLVKTPNRTRPFWSLGKVLRLIRGKDGRVRSACILRDKCEQIHSLNHLYPLEIREASSEPQAVPDLEEEEGGPFFCPTCSVRNDGSSPMVCCDGCSRWYHFDCVGVSDEVTEEEWNCPECTEQTTSSVDQLPEHD